MTSPRPLRSDAARRRMAVLDAAAGLFAEQGIDIPLEAVADRAGVGRATLYRNYPDRNALIAAVLEQKFDALEARAAEYSDRPDGLFALLEEMSLVLERAATLSDALRHSVLGDNRAERVQARIQRIFAPAIRQAVAAGLVRPDLTTDDAVTITRMLGGALRGGMGPNRRERAITLLIDGLKVASTTEAGPRG